MPFARADLGEVWVLVELDDLVEEVDDARRRRSSPLNECVDSVRARGEPNHSLLFDFVDPVLPALVHRPRLSPANPPFRSSSLLAWLAVLAPDLLSRDEERKRLIVPRVRMSSALMLPNNPDFPGVGEGARRMNGLNSRFGLLAQPEVIVEVLEWWEGVGVSLLSLPLNCALHGSGSVAVLSFKFTW